MGRNTHAENFQLLLPSKRRSLSSGSVLHYCSCPQHLAHIPPQKATHCACSCMVCANIGYSTLHRENHSMPNPASYVPWDGQRAQGLGLCMLATLERLTGTLLRNDPEKVHCVCCPVRGVVHRMMVAKMSTSKSPGLVNVI
jgi:hypothetical protein